MRNKVDLECIICRTRKGSRMKRKKEDARKNKKKIEKLKICDWLKSNLKNVSVKTR